jgi:hypothetical protein
MGEVNWGYAQVVTITDTSAQIIPAKGSANAAGQVRRTGAYLIQPIDGKIRIAYDAAASATESAAVGQDVRDSGEVNNEIRAIRDADEGANVRALVCYEVQ